jgi:hypothetical protein
MFRSVSFLLASVIALSIGTPTQQDQAHVRQEALQKIEQMRQESTQLNELAGHISSMQDARKFVDGLAAVFQDELPPEWATQDLRERLANAEYLSATDPTRLIPEQRVADAWNKYVRAIGAPQEALVTATEIHYLRDSYYPSVRSTWDRGIKNIWTMPDIYATSADGKVANGCRAVEALRTIHDLDSYFWEMRAGLREQVKTGVLPSDSVKQSTNKPQRTAIKISSGSYEKPVLAAERRYVHEHGEIAMMELANDLVNDVLGGD